MSQPEPPAVSAAARRPAPVPQPGPAPSGHPVPRQAGHHRPGCRREQLVAWIQHLESSRSWRITRPLRDARCPRQAAARQPVKPARAARGLQRGPPGAAAAAGRRSRRVRARAAAAAADPRQRRPGLAARARTRPAAEAAPGRDGAPRPGRRGRGGDPDPRPRPAPTRRFEEFDPRSPPVASGSAKLIAFYLPQFHSIPENDAWWGEGFTDWRNVARGIPRFAGHYQPRIPRDLGYLRPQRPGGDPAPGRARPRGGPARLLLLLLLVQRQAAAGAPARGSSSPTPRIDFPFCVTWANENWTRRWDGLDEETLIRQEHDPDDDEGLVDDLQRHFEDPRYIRIEGRPLFLVYRFDVLADARETVARWRELWRERHDEDPLILLVQSFEDDPRPYGADGAVEFPPQRMARWDNTIGSEPALLRPPVRGLRHRLRVGAECRAAAAGACRIRGPAGSPRPGTTTPAGRARARSSTAPRPSCTSAGCRRSSTPRREHPVARRAARLHQRLERVGRGRLPRARRPLRRRLPERDRPRGLPRPATSRRRQLPGELAAEKTKVLLVGHDAHPHGAQMNLRGLGERLRAPVRLRGRLPAARGRAR